MGSELKRNGKTVHIKNGSIQNSNSKLKPGYKVKSYGGNRSVELNDCKKKIKNLSTKDLVI